MALLNPVISSYTGKSSFDDIPYVEESFTMDSLKKYTNEPAVEISGHNPWKLLQHQLICDAEIATRQPVDEMAGIQNLLSALSGDEGFLAD